MITINKIPVDVLENAGFTYLGMLTKKQANVFNNAIKDSWYIEKVLYIQWADEGNIVYVWIKSSWYYRDNYKLQSLYWQIIQDMAIAQIKEKEPLYTDTRNKILSTFFKNEGDTK